MAARRVAGNVGGVGVGGASAGGAAGGIKNTTGGVARGVTASPVPSSNTGMTAMEDIFGNAPIPTAGTPYLQSGRLAPPSTGMSIGISKVTLKRMESILGELNIETKPSVPTKRICDLYDVVRREVLTLLTLQKICLKKEGEVVAKRVKLEKMAGSAVAQDVANQALVAQQAAAKAAIEAASKTTTSKKGGGVKGKGGGKGTGKKGGKKKASTDGGTNKAGTKRKAPTKKASAKGGGGAAAAGPVGAVVTKGTKAGGSQSVSISGATGANNKSPLISTTAAKKTIGKPSEGKPKKRAKKH